MEQTEPTLTSRLAAIDRTLARGIRFRMLVGTMRRGTGLLQDDHEEPLLLAEMIRLRNTRPIRTWWSLNRPSEPIDLLFCCHRTTDTEDGTPPPPDDIGFAPRGNRVSSPHNSDEGSAGSDDEQSSDGDQPESSTTAAGRTTSSRTTRAGNTGRNTLRMHRINWADVGESDPESNIAADLGLNLTSRAISAPPAPNSSSTPSPG